MPPAPPVRTMPAHYHFHTYDYAGALPFQTSAAQPWARNRWQFYSLVQDLNGLAAYGTGVVPNLAAVPTAVGGPTTEGRQTLMLSFGNAGAVAGRPTVVITGGVHAREWIAAEVAYLIAEYLIFNYVTPAAGNLRRLHLQNLVNTRNIHIIPMLNPDGNNRTVFGWGFNDRSWRKNQRPLPHWGTDWITALMPNGPHNPPTLPFENVLPTMRLWAQFDVPNYNPAPGLPGGAPRVFQTRSLPNDETGVDVNRNMPTAAWGYDPGGQWNPARDSFFGNRRGGEPEAANLVAAMATAAGGPAGHIDVAIDYHSYGQLILYPGEAGYNGAVTPAHTDNGQMLQALIRDAGGVAAYHLGTPLALVHYNATGTVSDYAAEQHQARSFTIELDPSTAAGAGDGGLAGFSLQENLIQSVFETNIRGALAAIEAPFGLAACNAAVHTYLPWAVHGAGNQVP